MPGARPSLRRRSGHAPAAPVGCRTGAAGMAARPAIVRAMMASDGDG
jgi:hypothetical protein